MNGLKDSIAEVGAPPCIGCPEYGRCKREGLSCLAFNDYVTASGRKPERGNPDRKHYEAMFQTFMEMDGRAA